MTNPIISRPAVDRHSYLLKSLFTYHTRIAGHSTASTIAANELSSSDGIFHVESSKVVQIMENLCAKGTKKNFKVETICFFNFKPTARRSNLNNFPPSTFVPYVKKD